MPNLSRILVLSFCAFTFAACKADLGPATASWQALENQFTQRVAMLKPQLASLREQIEAIPGASASKTRVAGQLKEAEELVKGFQTQLASANNAMQQAFQSGELNTVNTVLTGIRTALESRVKRAMDSIATLNKEVAAVTIEAKAQAEAEAKAKAEAEARALARKEELEKAAKQGGSVVFADLRFVRATADVASESGDALRALIEFSNSCKGLAFDATIFSPASGNVRADQQLAMQRALFLRARLVKDGAAASAPARFTGKVTTETPPSLPGAAEPAVAEAAVTPVADAGAATPDASTPDADAGVAAVVADAGEPAAAAPAAEVASSDGWVSIKVTRRCR